MSNWNHEQSYNNAGRSYHNFYDNFYRYPSQPFTEQRPGDPRGVMRPFNHPPAASIPPPPPSLRPPLPVWPSPVAGLPLPPFYRHVPPPPLPRQPFPPPPDMCGNQFVGIPAQFSGPPPQNGHFSVPPPQNGNFSVPPPQNGHHPLPHNPCHYPGFAPNHPSGNHPACSLPPPSCPPPVRSSNCLPPVRSLSNCPRPAARGDYRAMAPRPVNRINQRQAGSLPFGDQHNRFPVKRHLNTGYNNRKVHVVVALVFVLN